MTAINWKKTQAALGVTADGLPGPVTYGALFGFAAGRTANDTDRAIGRQFAAVARDYGITDSAERLADFLAQTAHESAGYTGFSENMNYSAKRIREVWPSRFPTIAAATPYANNPRALANQVYNGRMGNRPSTDDGWNNRGGGMLQHTGAGEYDLLKARLGYSPDDVRDPAKSVVAALDFYQRRGVFAFVDKADAAGARRAVNGGVLGLDDVNKKRARLLGVLR